MWTWFVDLIFVVITQCNLKSFQVATKVNTSQQYLCNVQKSCRKWDLSNMGDTHPLLVRDKFRLSMVPSFLVITFINSRRPVTYTTEEMSFLVENWQIV